MPITPTKVTHAPGHWLARQARKQLFTARFTPDDGDRAAEADVARAGIVDALDAVPSLDDDRTLRAMLALIESTVRTNAFRPGTRRRRRAAA